MAFVAVDFLTGVLADRRKVRRTGAEWRFESHKAWRTITKLSFVMAGIEFFLLRVFTPIADRIGTHRVFALGIAGFGIKALAVSLMPTPQMIIAACVTQTVSFCLYFPGRMRVLSEEVEQESLAGAFATAGIYSSLVNILLVNPVTGYLSESIGTAAMMRCFTLLCLAAGAAYYFITARIKAKQETAAQ